MTIGKQIHGCMMINHIISTAGWHYLGYLLLVIPYIVLLIVITTRRRKLEDSLHTLAAEVADLRSAQQMLSDKLELLNSGYRELPEYLTEQRSVDRISDVVSPITPSCWYSLLKISAGDKNIAGDLAKMLVDEIPTIIKQLKRIHLITELERELFHQWRGLFRCCGMQELAERFNLGMLCKGREDAVLDAQTKDELICHLREVLVETFHSLRRRDDFMAGELKEISSLR